MKKIQNVIRKLAVVLPAFALAIGVMSVNSACYTYFHQPETPDEMNAYRR